MKQKSLNDAEIEKRLRGMFERNYQRLRLESGHALTPEIKEAALQQVLYYWKKLRDLANTITDTEVRLHLPNQLSRGNGSSESRVLWTSYGKRGTQQCMTSRRMPRNTYARTSENMKNS